MILGLTVNTFDSYIEAKRILCSELDLLSDITTRYPVTCIINSENFTFNNKEDIEYLIEVLGNYVSKIRKINNGKFNK